MLVTEMYQFLKKFSSSIHPSPQAPIITSQIQHGNSIVPSLSVPDVLLVKSDQCFILLLDIQSSFSQKHSLTHPCHQLQDKVQTEVWMKLIFLG